MALEAALPVLDHHQLRNATLDDPELMRDIVSTLIEDAGEQMKLLEEALERRDARACRSLAHYLKGACANVGAASSAAILQEVERAAAGADFGGCSESLRVLGEELEKLRSAAAAILSTGAQAPVERP